MFVCVGSMLRTTLFVASMQCLATVSITSGGVLKSLPNLSTPIIFKGGPTVAYRDPAAVYIDGVFRLFFTLVETEADGQVYMYTAWSKSSDLVHWTEPVKFTPRNQSLDYSSPGDIIRFEDEWVICLQTYCRPNGEKNGNSDSRIWTMRSKDLENWGQPEMLRVKGPNVPQADMGRMIDAYLLEDKDEAGKYWAFFKQNGASRAWSHDLTVWNYSGHSPAGENVCVIVNGTEYLMFHSPSNGVGMKRSNDLAQWTDLPTLTLGQSSWAWAQGRLTASFVLDLRHDPDFGKALMFYHGSAYPEKDPRGGFDTFASLGLAWSDSDDLLQWSWPGKDAVSSMV